MAANPVEVGTHVVAETGALGQLISSLRARGYEVIGPTLRDGAIVYDTLESMGDLPAGWTDQQAPGKYRVEKGDGGKLFGYVVGPTTWKRFLHPAEVRLFQIENNGGGFRVTSTAASQVAPKQAFLGVRACELAAIAMQDRVLLGDKYVDPIYQNRRKDVFLIAVQCTQASSSCFCASMGTGPHVKGGYDLVLTEIADNGRTCLVISAGSEAGVEVLREMEVRKAPADSVSKAQKAVDGAAAMITRRLDMTGVRELLYAQFEHPRWDDVARRCLTCGNCTMACPTCFCITVDEASDVNGHGAERWRRWDSCFTQGFSYIHGGSVRLSPKSRYRQWLTHKLAAWQDQFGSPGCVGCGRCITWCPAGIEITEEVAAIRGGPEGERRNGERQQSA